jgi:glycosyltransferase involved in cell wall biosynthesis
VAHLVVVSFRLGGTDGVSIEAAKWIGAFEELGHRVTTLAGEGNADVLMPEIGLRATSPPSKQALKDVVNDADLVVVENLASLPLNVAARDVLYDVLDGRRALFHHHDLPWQREQWLDESAPRDQALWRHVTINDLSRDELRERGIAATTVHNTFDCDPPRGRREATRDALGVANERLALLATRAIPRKNVEGALELAEALGFVLWLLGPAEDGYGPTLEALLSKTNVRVVRGLPPSCTIHDAYAASDLVVMPSTWEGFGNPVLESVTHRRPLAVYPYPVLEEIRRFGFRFFDLNDAASIENFLITPHGVLLEHNHSLARRHFNVADLPQRLAPLLETLSIK